MKRYIIAVFAFVACFLFSSCEEDKTYLTLPVFELGVSSDEIHVGDNIHVSLTNINNPGNMRINSYVWECDKDVDGLQSSTPNTNNSFAPFYPGKHELKVTINISNHADGNPADNGRTIVSPDGKTTNKYVVSTLKTFVTVTRTFNVKPKNN